MATAQTKSESRRQNANLSRRILVSVKRDPMLETPTVVWQHEIPILEEIFGEGSVKPVDLDKMDEGFTPKASPGQLVYNKTQEAFCRPSESQGIGFVFIGDAAGEYERLSAAYGRHKEENISLVEKIYGRAQSGQFRSLLGRPELDDLPEKQLRELILAYGHAPEVHKDATTDEKRAFAAARKELAEMPHGDLVKLAVTLEIQLG